LDGTTKPMQYVTTITMLVAAVFVAMYVLVPTFPPQGPVILTGLFIFNLSVYVYLEASNVRNR